MRVQINLSEEMCASVDSYAKKMGVSRSALCSMLIGQGIMNYDNSYKIAEKVLKDTAKMLGEDFMGDDGD